MTRHSDGFHFVPDFTEYGNQPKIFFVAFNSRSRIEARSSSKKKAMKRRTIVNGLDRVSHRVDVCKADAWCLFNMVRKGRSWISAAPRSPATHWLQRQDYQQFPF